MSFSESDYVMGRSSDSFDPKSDPKSGLKSEPTMAEPSESSDVPSPAANAYVPYLELRNTRNFGVVAFSLFFVFLASMWFVGFVFVGRLRVLAFFAGIQVATLLPLLFLLYIRSRLIVCNDEKIAVVLWPKRWEMRWNEITHFEEKATSGAIKLVDRRKGTKFSIPWDFENFGPFRRMLRRKVGDLGFYGYLPAELVKRVDLPYEHMIFSPLKYIGGAAVLVPLAIVGIFWTKDVATIVFLLGLCVLPFQLAGKPYSAKVSSETLELLTVFRKKCKSIPIACITRLEFEPKISAANFPANARTICYRLDIFGLGNTLAMEIPIRDTNGEVLRAAIIKAVLSHCEQYGIDPQPILGPDNHVEFSPTDSQEEDDDD